MLENEKDLEKFIYAVGKDFSFVNVRESSPRNIYIATAYFDKDKERMEKRIQVIKKFISVWTDYSLYSPILYSTQLQEKPQNGWLYYDVSAQLRCAEALLVLLPCHGSIGVSMEVGCAYGRNIPIYYWDIGYP